MSSVSPKCALSLPCRDFLGIDPGTIQKLAALGILNAGQMLAAGSTPAERAALAGSSALPEPQLLELVKLSDLSRLPGVKAIRARLYYDAGVDTVEKLAGFEPDSAAGTHRRFRPANRLPRHRPSAQGSPVHHRHRSGTAEGCGVLMLLLRPLIYNLKSAILNV